MIFISLSHKSESPVLEPSSLLLCQCMSPKRYEYQGLGLELVELAENTSHLPKKPHMAGEEKRDDKEGYTVKLLLKESLVRQRNKVMDNFTQILQRMSMAVDTP